MSTKAPMLRINQIASQKPDQDWIRTLCLEVTKTAKKNHLSPEMYGVSRDERNRYILEPKMIHMILDARADGTSHAKVIEDLDKLVRAAIHRLDSRKTLKHKINKDRRMEAASWILFLILILIAGGVYFLMIWLLGIGG